MDELKPLTNKDIQDVFGNKNDFKMVNLDRVLEAKQGLINELSSHLWGHDYSEMQKEQTILLIHQWFQIEEVIKQ